jgi:hypothetical protein
VVFGGKMEILWWKLEIFSGKWIWKIGDLIGKKESSEGINSSKHHKTPQKHPKNTEKHLKNSVLTWKHLKNTSKTVFLT